jgi:hypothetical protein
MSTEKRGSSDLGALVGRHPFDGRTIRFKTGWPAMGGPYLQLGKGDTKSNHALPDVILSRDNVDGKFRLTENEAVEIVCLPKYPKTKAYVAGKPIKVGVGRQGPYITFNEVYMNVVAPIGLSIFQLDSNALKGLLKGMSVAVTALTKDNLQLTSTAAPTPFVTPTKASGREKPSCLSPLFVSKVKEAFDPCHLLPPEVATAVDVSGLAYTADLLDVVLRSRLKHHIANIASDAHGQHYVWDFARDNMKQVAVAMIVMGHIAPFAELVQAIENPEQCLLGNLSNFVHLTPQLHDKLQGCYLMRTREIGFFHSGQVAGRPFRDRFQEHSIMAQGSAPSATRRTSLNGDKSIPVLEIPSSDRESAPSKVRYLACSWNSFLVVSLTYEIVSLVLRFRKSPWQQTLFASR